MRSETEGKNNSLTLPTAVELAKLGHSITLIDISQSELALAAEHAAASNITLASVHCADASKLLSTLPDLQSQLA